MAHSRESKFFLSGTVSPVSVFRLNLQPKRCIPRMLRVGGRSEVGGERRGGGGAATLPAHLKPSSCSSRPPSTGPPASWFLGMFTVGRPRPGEGRTTRDRSGSRQGRGPGLPASPGLPGLLSAPASPRVPARLAQQVGAQPMMNSSLAAPAPSPVPLLSAQSPIYPSGGPSCPHIQL